MIGGSIALSQSHHRGVSHCHPFGYALTDALTLASRKHGSFHISPMTLKTFVLEFRAPSSRQHGGIVVSGFSCIICYGSCVTFVSCNTSTNIFLCFLFIYFIFIFLKIKFGCVSIDLDILFTHEI
jgi:hypothetical protein